MSQLALSYTCCTHSRLTLSDCCMHSLVTWLGAGSVVVVSLLTIISLALDAPATAPSAPDSTPSWTAIAYCFGAVAFQVNICQPRSLPPVSLICPILNYLHRYNSLSLTIVFLPTVWYSPYDFDCSERHEREEPPACRCHRGLHKYSQFFSVSSHLLSCLSSLLILWKFSQVYFSYSVSCNDYILSLVKL